MSAFGHAGFGSSNRRNQLKAQGQIGGQDQYGNQVRQAMQPPTMSVYNAPQSYQQNTGQQTAANATGARSPVQYGSPVSVGGGSSMPTPGMAQPIQPQSQGTPYGAQAVTGGGYPAQSYGSGQMTQERIDEISSRANAQPKAEWSRPVGERNTEYLKQQLRETLTAHPPGSMYYDWAQQEMQGMQSELARRGVTYDAQQDMDGRRKEWLQQNIDAAQYFVDSWNNQYNQSLSDNPRLLSSVDEQRHYGNAQSAMDGRVKAIADWRKEMEGLSGYSPGMTAMTGGPGRAVDVYEIPGGKGADDPRLARAGVDMYGIPGGKGADDPRLARAGVDMYGMTGGDFPVFDMYGMTGGMNRIRP